MDGVRFPAPDASAPSHFRTGTWQAYTWLTTFMSTERQSDGAPPGQPSRARIVGKLFPPNLLPALVGLAQTVSALLPVLEGYIRFHLVLDANIIQGELRWRLGKRENSTLHWMPESPYVAPILTML